MLSKRRRGKLGEMKLQWTVDHVLISSGSRWGEKCQLAQKDVFLVFKITSRVPNSSSILVMISIFIFSYFFTITVAFKLLFSWMPKDDIALVFFMLHIDECIFMLYMNGIYEECSLLQGKLDSWPSNSFYGFLGSKARTLHLLVW